MTPAETNTDTITPNEEAHEHSHEHQHAAPPRSECERELTVEIPQDVVSREFNTLLARYGKQARLPGFRKGKVPTTMLKRQFGDQIKQEVLDRLIPQYIQDESQKQNLRPISQPRLTDLHAHEDQPWRFTAIFETFPEVNVGDYKNTGIHIEPVQITDEDLEQQIAALREQHANYDPVEEERELRDGDFAAVSFEGTPKAKQGEDAPTPNPARMDDVLVEIGGNNTVPEFSENLRGAKVGEERTFEVSYPEDFSEQRLAGQTINYTVKVNGIKKKSLPELNDDFAKELGQFENYEDFKNKFRDNMRREREQEAERQAKDRLVQHLVEHSRFPVPEVFINQQVDMRLNRGLQALAQQGMRQEDMRKLNFNALRSGQREQAIQEVKAAMILDKIANQENIQVTDEELDNEIQVLAAHTNEDYHTLRSRLSRDGSLERIRERMRNEKTLNHLLQS